jgi:hypothetical protein
LLADPEDEAPGVVAAGVETCEFEVEEGLTVPPPQPTAKSNVTHANELTARDRSFSQGHNDCIYASG